MTRAPRRASAKKPAEPTFTPALALLRTLWRLNHALERLSSLMARTSGITAQQRFLLRVVEERPDLSAADLAPLLHLDPGTVSVSLSRLRARGLVARERDPRDRRRGPLRLTKRGAARVRAGAFTVEGAAAKVLARTPPRERARLARVLETLALAFEIPLAARRAQRRTHARAGGVGSAGRARQAGPLAKPDRRVPPPKGS